ncbi:MAG: hypothetical protein OXC80_13330 [Gammaproteobacteria bacterium]|nr:hypothetical protein [Gammaproteobacteria bacterium]
MEEFAQFLAVTGDTEFGDDTTLHMIENLDQIESWRVGEAIAEAYLTDHRSSFFPWSSRWDEKTRRASLPGADLIGLAFSDKEDCFVFGEVKTSSESRYPPSVMYGRTGFKRQLEQLRDDHSKRLRLIRYLYHRAKDESWYPRFTNAARRYMTNKSDVQIYGFLVRDVVPNSADLRARVQNLGSSCPKGMRIELFAMYLPERSLRSIKEKISTLRTGGEDVTV